MQPMQCKHHRLPAATRYLSHDSSSTVVMCDGCNASLSGARKRLLMPDVCVRALQVKVVASRSCGASLGGARQVQRGCVSTVIGRCQQVCGCGLWCLGTFHTAFLESLPRAAWPSLLWDTTQPSAA